MTGRRMAGRALFLDRDGVVNVDHGYVHRIADVEFVPGIFDLARAAAGLGFRPVVVTNQSGIARGLYGPEAFRAMTAWMAARFAAEGAPLAGVFHCPFLPGGTPPFDRDSFWRKPNPGMILEAAIRLDLDVGRSILVGDQPSDMAAARAAGVGLRIAFGAGMKGGNPDADNAADDLAALARDLHQLAGPLLSSVA